MSVPELLIELRRRGRGDLARRLYERAVARLPLDVLVAEAEEALR